MEPFTFIKTKDSEIPYELLLLADETIEAIDQYIFNCDIYLHDGTENIAVMALYKTSDAELEIKNIAVIETYRNKGIGSILINKAKEIAQESHYQILTVGTSDTGFNRSVFMKETGSEKQGSIKIFL
jgi:ribosomal protein S18 acetylase RimI-like enzyme